MSDQVSTAKDKSGGTSLVYTAIGDTPLIHQVLPDVVHPTPLGYQRICDLIKIKKIK